MPTPRKTDEELRRAGTWRPFRHGAKKPPTWPTGRPPRPRWLSREARRVWDDIVPKLVAARLIGPMDRALLTAYCVTFAAWREAIEAVRDAELDERPGLQRIAHQLYGDVLKGAAELGMTPKARRNIRPLEADAGGEADPTSVLAIVNHGEAL